MQITGIEEKPGETCEGTANTISKLQKEKLQLPPVKLEAHRTGPATPSRPSTVVERFEKYGDHKAVIRNAKNTER